MNVSLRSGEVPDCLKSAVLVPGLKKPSLETNDFSSFRPISNLKFVAKAIEKVVAVQTCQHILDNNLDELYQSAYNDAWMACNKLELNGGKTELLVLNACHRPLPPLESLLVCGDVISRKSKVRNIGVMMDRL